MMDNDPGKPLESSQMFTRLRVEEASFGGSLHEFYRIYTGERRHSFH